MKYLLYCLILSLLPTQLCAHDQISHQIHFAVIGDYGNGSEAEKKVGELIAARNPAFIITLGDNNYPQGCWSSIDLNIGQYYHQFIGKYKGAYGKGATTNKFYPTLGNHDWLALTECSRHNQLPYQDYFTLPGNGRYYDFVKGPVHFFALDSDMREPDGHEIGSHQYLWLVDKLRGSKAAFNLVYFHHAPYSSGSHGDTEYMQWNFASIGADLIMSGHDHDYERIERDGIVYFVNGAGGAGLYKMKTPTQDSVFFYSKHHGFLWVEADNHMMTIQFINTNNEIIDEKVISK